MAALPPAHRQPNDDHDQSDLQDQPEDRGQSAQTPEHPAPKQHAEQAGAEETSKQTAEESRPAEEAAQGRRRRRTLRGCAARLARLRHTTFNGPRARRCRRRRRRGEGLRAATAEAPAAASAGVGIGYGKCQHRHQCAKHKQQTSAKTRHDILPGHQVYTAILVSHCCIVRGAAWCRRRQLGRGNLVRFPLEYAKTRTKSQPLSERP